MTTFDPDATQGRRWGVILVSAVAAFGLLIAVTFVPIFHGKSHHLHLKTCFQEASGLSRGAAVRMFGVEVGSVRRVQVDPGNHACPVSVEMTLKTDYELAVPIDSQAYISQSGVLGPALLYIDSASASGKPASDWATIPSKTVRVVTFQDVQGVLDRLSKTCGAVLSEVDRQAPGAKK